MIFDLFGLGIVVFEVSIHIYTALVALLITLLIYGTYYIMSGLDNPDKNE